MRRVTRLQHYAVDKTFLISTIVDVSARLFFVLGR